MVGKTKLLTMLAALVQQTRADEVSVCAHAKMRRVFRFAQEAIHQDLTQTTLDVTVRVMRDQRVGVAGTDALQPDGLARCARAALDLARHAPRQANLPAQPAGHRLQTAADYVPATVKLPAAAQVVALRRLMHLCKGVGADLAGSLMSGEDAFAVVNSSGVRQYAASTIAGAKLVTAYRKLSGFASAVHRDAAALDLDRVLQRSLRQSLHRQDPVALPIGEYDVILEPAAVAELLVWLGSIAFGAKNLEEHTSFLAGRMGERVMHPSITIYDDGHELGSLRLPFDFEGTPRQRVVLIDRGRAAGVVYDTLYGSRFGQPSTGHALGPDEIDGPLPLHLAMAPGRVSLEQMIRSCRRGLLIPRVHYVNGLLNPREALMTGLTREGAFLIEDGKLAAPITTLRFTQGLLDAFSRVLGISKTRELVADPIQELGCALVPALHLAKFNFTGRSES